MTTLSQESQIVPLPELAHVRVREVAKTDRARIQSLLELTKVFSVSEIQCALELFDVYCKVGSSPDEYVFMGAYGPEDVLLGFICYGKASLTDSTYDLYWIVVDPEYRGRSIGALLMEALDQNLIMLEARLVLAETSSRLDYQNAHRFYEKHQFQKFSTISDYYAPGDDLIVYGKRYK